MKEEQGGFAAEPNIESLLWGAHYLKKGDLALREMPKSRAARVAVYSGQTSKIIGIAVTTTRISSGNPMRQ